MRVERAMRTFGIALPAAPSTWVAVPAIELPRESMWITDTLNVTKHSQDQVQRAEQAHNISNEISTELQFAVPF